MYYCIRAQFIPAVYSFSRLTNSLIITKSTTHPLTHSLALSRKVHWHGRPVACLHPSEFFQALIIPAWELELNLDMSNNSDHLLIRMFIQLLD